MNKKKKILFFHFDLQGGGAEKVLVNLLNHLNPDKYDITLRVVFGVGPYVEKIPSYVHYKPVFRFLFKGLPALLKIIKGKWLYRLFVTGKYDIEIAYLETLPTRIISYSTNPDSRKLAWVHIEFTEQHKHSRSFRDINEATSSYNRFDKILFVSHGCKKAFFHYLPEVKTASEVIYNVNDYELISSLSKEEIPFILDHDVINICSVGRLTSQKRFDRLINAMARLKKDGFKLHLYLLGEGEERKELEEQIRRNSLEKEVTLLGFVANPYKYVAKMDLFVCSSEKEGYSTAVTEAVALGVPVLTTDCSGMDEVLRNGDFGLIVKNDEDALYEGLKALLDEPRRIARYKERLKAEGEFTTQAFVDRYEELFDSL